MRSCDICPGGETCAGIDLAPILSVMEALMVAPGGRKALEAITESEEQLDKFSACWRTSQQAPGRQGKAE